MPTDLSRRKNNSKRQYTAVRFQQNRPLLDADWNEQLAIDQQINRSRITDLVGRSGATKKENGFEIKIELGAAAPFLHKLIVQPGRIYVNGLLCELSHTLHQPIDVEPGNYLVYLEAWQQEINYLQDPSLQEVALGEADTATRLKTVWEIRLRKIIAGETEVTTWENIIHELDGKLSVRLRHGAIEESPSQLPPSLGYRRQENQLYRIEIHQGSSDASQSATFKWSRDNGTVETLIERFDPYNGKLLQVGSVGKDEVLGFAAGNWVEIEPAGVQKETSPELLSKIKAVYPESFTIELEGEIPTRGKGFLLRRWDQNGAGTPQGQSLEPDWMDLEAGIQVKFSSGNYRTGDYWLIPARQLTRNIEWPINPETGDPQALAPHGHQRHYAKLAILRIEAGKGKAENCRPTFSPLTELMAEDIIYQNSTCFGGTSVNTVQKALYLLYQRRAGAYTFLVGPEEENWPQVFNQIEAGSSAHIHFQIGTYQLPETIVLQSKGHLKITGCGPGTKIMGTSIESCMVFEKCESILIRDIHLETQKTFPNIDHYAPLIPNGTLTFLDCDDVNLEHISIKCGWGPQPKLSCVSVRNGLFAGSINIQHCELLVGYLQEGIYLRNPIRAIIKNNHIRAYNHSDQLTFEELLKDEAFLAGVRDFFILKPSFSRAITGSNVGIPYPHLRPTVYNLTDTSGQRNIFYRTHQGLRNAWNWVLNDYPSETGLSTEDDLGPYFKSRTDRILTDPEFRNQSVFEGAFSLVYNTLASQPILGGSAGIRVTEFLSSRIKDLKILNNNLEGLLQGIAVSRPKATLSIGGNPVKPKETGTINIAGNSIQLTLPAVTHNFNIGAIAVNHYQRTLIENNHITLQRQLGTFSGENTRPTLTKTPISGIQMEGPFGKTMILSQNRLEGRTEQAGSGAQASSDLSFDWAIDINIKFENPDLISENEMMWAVRWNHFAYSRLSVRNLVGDNPIGSFTPSSGEIGQKTVSQGVTLESNTFFQL